MKIIEFKNFFKIIGIYGLQVIYVLFTNFGNARCCTKVLESCDILLNYSYFSTICNLELFKPTYMLNKQLTAVSIQCMT